ncbi:MAG TPA: hypothetical protein VFB45_26560 [Pseudolabrys sp.]|nr:hypothetical protein [Pseudolabrys sp.]
MRTLTKAILVLGAALGTAMAMDISVPSVAKAQGFAIDAPGVHVRVGRRHHHRYYDNYYGGGYGAYDYAGPRRGGGYYTYNGCQPGFTIQSGVCKPYRGY